ncbi:MAG: hypothetical protein ACLPZY_15995 [Terracidiphilus sp.]
MIRRHPIIPFRPGRNAAATHLPGNRSCVLACACTLAAFLSAVSIAAQVITIDTSGKGKATANGPIDRQFTQIAPTKVDLTKTELDAKTRLMLIREMQSEQGFAMRPFPRGHKGLTLEANGKLEPAGEAYLNMVVNEGLSTKPGGRLVITNIKIGRDRIIFDLNDGPDAKHRFLRHVQIGMGPDMGDPDIDPTLANQDGDPTGSRLTLVFHDHVPELTGQQVKALLAPLISFDVKTPIQAFTDTLPPELKKAILDHHVLVGMSTDMVLYAKGRPSTKSREMDGQMPFEEWIYGTPPEEVDFVRINGNRVIRLEIAKGDEPMQVFTKDVVSAMLRTDGTPVMTAQTNTRTIREGDVQVDPDKQAPAAPPSLRNPGEQLPTDQQTTGVMRPVQMPKPHTDDGQLGANPDEQQQTPATAQGTQPANGQTSQPANGQPAPTGSQQPSSGSQQTAPGTTKPSPSTAPSQFATSSNATPATLGAAQSN